MHVPGADVKDEAELIREAQRGNSQSFGELVRAHQDRLYSSLLHVVDCPEEAYDVVQDAFVQALLKITTFKQESKFYTWLYRIAFNRAKTTQRRQRPAFSVERSDEMSGSDLLDPAETPDDLLIRQERITFVRRALSELSEKHRAVMVLREVENCDYETIATILEISVGTVRSRLHRARAQMRQTFERLESAQPVDSQLE
ncbi:MAG TPA: sigma-70 family RNA polymerase sigma factor [Planctomycetaceae bacterium]|nr:sigma-70 family RNA polymerase sigma factor [Planctomycetaceae bacterium]